MDTAPAPMSRDESHGGARIEPAALAVLDPQGRPFVSSHNTCLPLDVLVRGAKLREGQNTVYFFSPVLW